MGRRKKRGRKRKIRNPAAFAAHYLRIDRAKEVERDRTRQRRFERSMIPLDNVRGRNAADKDPALSDRGGFVFREIEKRELTLNEYLKRINWAMGNLPRKYYRYKSLLWRVCTSSGPRETILNQFGLDDRRYTAILDELTIHFWKLSQNRA